MGEGHLGGQGRGAQPHPIRPGTHPLTAATGKAAGWEPGLHTSGTDPMLGADLVHTGNGGKAGLVFFVKGSHVK